MGCVIELFHVEQGTGIPVVFLHGYPLDHRIWLPLLPYLGNGIHAVLPDLRGHGQSPAPEGTYSMELMAEDVIRLMDQLRIEKAVIAGHSMGGYVTFKLWNLFPQRILGIGLVATRAKADSPVRKMDRLKTAEEVLKSGSSKVVESMVTQLTKQTRLYPHLRAIMGGVSAQGIAGTLRGVAGREDATQWLKDINVPVEVIAGGEDQIVTLAESIEMAKELPMGELKVIDKAGHIPMMEEPEKVAESIRLLTGRINNKS